MTEVLLAVGLTGAGLQGCAAVGAVLWTRYYRPRHMMRWAVRHAAEMGPLTRTIFLAGRRANRVMVQLRIVLVDQLTPAMREFEQRLITAFRIPAEWITKVCPVCDGEGVLPPLGRRAAYVLDWPRCDRCRGSGTVRR